MDWSLLFIGVLLTLGSYRGYRRPERDIASVTGWRNRLDELNNGAPEGYFEEKRQLEAFPPPKSATERSVRFFSVIGPNL